MAILKNSGLGNFSGRVGEMVFRVVNGKTIISQRPVYTPHPLSPQEILARGKFGTSQKFSKEVNSNPHLKPIWKSAFKNSWTSICKFNLAHVSQYTPTPQNIIVPPGGFPLLVVYDKISLKSFAFHLFDLPVEFSPPPLSIDIVCLNCWFDPVNPKESDPFIIESTYQTIPVDKFLQGSSYLVSDRYTFESVSNIYRHKIYYFTLLAQSGDEMLNNKLLYSETVSLEV